MLFKKLLCKGVQAVYLVRLLTFWYSEQVMYIRWLNIISEGFKVSSGVRQGGILSPHLFSLYMDNLSVRLNNVHTACMMRESKINHLMYADDIVLISPTALGLSELLRVCEIYSNECDVLFNSSKSSILVFRCKLLKDNFCSKFLMENEEIPVNQRYKYLGHLLSVDLRDDISRQRKKVYAQGNMLIRKFGMCTDTVNKTLFKAYCTPYIQPTCGGTSVKQPLPSCMLPITT